MYNKMKKAELVAIISQMEMKKAELIQVIEQMEAEAKRLREAEVEIRDLKAEVGQPDLGAEVEAALAVWPASRPIPAELRAAMLWGKCLETGHLKVRVERSYYLKNSWVRKFLYQFMEYARRAGHHAFLGRDGAGGFLRISSKPI